jgi:acyl-CoA dehydrogenase
LDADSDPDAVVAVARAAAVVAAAGAPEADRNAAFPLAALAPMAQTRLLAAALPVALGGLGCGLRTLTEVAGILARGCGSTAMVWAMHQLQVACVARHAGTAGVLQTMLASLARDHLLIASATSEQGVGGNIRTSRAPVLVDGPACGLDKQATTVSYGRQAGAFLVTLRRDHAAAPDEQVAVLVHRDQTQREVTGAWNPMGMRGTDSPAMRLRASFDREQILPVPFGDIASATMVPLAHLLWSAVWIGLATEAFERARRLTRARRRSAASPDPRLAHADRLLSGLEARLTDAVERFDPCYRQGRLPTAGYQVRANALKVAASEDSVRVTELSLELCGMAGYQEDGEYSVARILRDLYSARLMIANDRLLAANATNLLTVRRS